MNGLSVAANRARTEAAALAAAASLGLLTTENADGSFGRVWRPTTAGYLWVRENRERGPL